MVEIKDKSNCVWLYDTHLKRFIYYFPTILDVLKFLAGNQIFSLSDFSEHNEYLDNINMGNDKKFLWFKNPHWSSEIEDYYHDGFIYSERRYIFVDGENRYIDFRNYQNEIEKLNKNKDFDYNSIPNKNIEYKKNHSYQVRFRIDPVPGLRCYKRYNGYRHIRTTNEKRLNSNPEVLEFVRAKRRPHNLLDSYDDIPRNYSRSWKDCSKKKRQWM